ncbi:MAG: hypothetical protein K9H14_03280 [Actinomycetia bacterium]|nr:hypothetical protein [Actinomycetes bacterium]
MRHKKAITKQLRARYNKATKKQKVIGYISAGGKRIRFVVDKRKKNIRS